MPFANGEEVNVGFFNKESGTEGAQLSVSRDKAVRLRCLRVNGFFQEDDQSDRFHFRLMPEGCSGI
jgi:hypothetical protein